jgi:hypothetical protein
MANEFESAAEDLGINLSSTPPSFLTGDEAPNEEQVESTEQTEETVEETDVLENEETPSTEVEYEEETVEEEYSDDDFLAELEKEQEEDDAYYEEVMQSEDFYDDTEEDNISDEEYEDMLFGAVGEMLGLDGLSKDSLLERLNTQTEATELDPRVKAIADFVAETGRDPQDWFAYQAMNPSEMDDITVMRQQLKQQYPDLSDSDADLLLDNKYKLDEDVHGEQDARLGKLQLSMDAQNARKDLEGLRESYKAPVAQTASEEPAEIESPITAEWISQMSAQVDDMEALEFSVGKDDTFSFGLTDSYKSSLKQSQASLDEYFDQYVDDSGNWDFAKLNVHRTLIDNIESIVDAAYKQGISAGTSNVVKQAVNPSNVTPSSNATSASSSEDKVRQQILNALQGGDDTLRLKF